MVFQERGASEIGMEDFFNDTKLTLTLLVQVKKLIAVVKLKKSSEELKTGTSSKYLINTQLLIPEW